MSANRTYVFRSAVLLHSRSAEGGHILFNSLPMAVNLPYNILISKPAYATHAT